MKLYQTSGDATVYGGDFGGRNEGNWDGEAFGFQTATGIPMDVVTNSVAMHDTSLKYHIARVTNHDTNITKYALITNVMGNPNSAGDLTPELAESLGVNLNEKPFHDESLDQTFRLVKGDDAKNLTFEVVGELTNKKYADIGTAQTVANRLGSLSSAADVEAFSDGNAVFYDEFKSNIAEKGFDYKPESKAAKNSEAIGRHGESSAKMNAVEANARLTSGYEHDPNDSDEEHKRKLRDTVAANYASANTAEQQALTAFFALILFALGEHEMAEQLLDRAFSDQSSTRSNANDEVNEAYSSSGTGGKRYNRNTREYDGDKTPSTSRTLGSYSDMVDPSQFGGESTLKGSKSTPVSKIRDQIKQEYTSRLDEYLYKGDISDIPKDVPVMVLDLGHLGKGNDLGAGKWVNGKYLCEAGACMETNIAAAKAFHEQGGMVVSTTQSPRFDSNTLSPGARQQFAQSIVNEVGKDRMFFMSTHFNAAGRSVDGAAMYTEMSNPRSMAYATEMQSAIVQAGYFDQFGKGIIDDKDSQHKALSVTSKSYASVLPELGFRDGDAATLSNKQKMWAVGETLAQAITVVGTERFGWKLQEKQVEPTTQYVQNESALPPVDVTPYPVQEVIERPSVNTGFAVPGTDEVKYSPAVSLEITDAEAKSKPAPAKVAKPELEAWRLSYLAELEAGVEKLPEADRVAAITAFENLAGQMQEEGRSTAAPSKGAREEISTLVASLAKAGIKPNDDLGAIGFVADADKALGEKDSAGYSQKVIEPLIAAVKNPGADFAKEMIAAKEEPKESAKEIAAKAKLDLQDDGKAKGEEVAKVDEAVKDEVAAEKTAAVKA